MLWDCGEAADGSCFKLDGFLFLCLTRCVSADYNSLAASSEFDLVPDRTCACVPSRGVTGKISGKAGGGSQFAAVRNSQAQRFATDSFIPSSPGFFYENVALTTP